jgi:hypothetical protein
LSPPPTLHPPLSGQKARPATYRKTEKERRLDDVRGGGGRGTKLYDGEKADPL